MVQTKSRRIYCWKKQGIICDNWQEIYIKYEEAKSCQLCKKIFNLDVYYNGSMKRYKNNKVLEHDHMTGKIRSIYCTSCNGKMRYEDANAIYKQEYEEKYNAIWGCK